MLIIIKKSFNPELNSRLTNITYILKVPEIPQGLPKEGFSSSNFNNPELIRSNTNPNY